MTFHQLTNRLREGGIEAPDHEAKVLLCRFACATPALLYAQKDRDFSSDALEEAVRRRLSHEPLQYILGEVGFYGECYDVSPDCLIPRADTELLVEEAIRRLPQGAVFADLCTGSGCIAISVLAHRPDLSAVAVDLSEAALEIAARNAVKNGVENRITLVQADLLGAPPKEIQIVSYLLSNPPYIPTAVIPTLSAEVAKEPRLALDGGADGLLFYRHLLDVFSPSLFLFEIGYDQKDALTTLGTAHGYTVKSKQDLGGNDRLMILTK